MKQYIIASVAIFGIAIIALGSRYRVDYKAERQCEEIERNLRANTISEDLTSWVDEKISTKYFDHGQTPRYPISQADYSVPIDLDVSPIGLNDDAEVQVIYDSNNQMRSVLLVDSDLRRVVISVSADRGVGWPAYNLIRITDRVSVLCPHR